MKRKNAEYEYMTDREQVVDVDFEALLEEFRQESRKRQKKRKRNRKKHK